jgi:hypothetical protein
MGPLVPWVDASIAPGRTDLNIGGSATKRDGIGESHFLTDHTVIIYVGLKAPHISNAGLNGSNRNFALNTVKSVVISVSWYFP